MPFNMIGSIISGTMNAAATAHTNETNKMIARENMQWQQQENERAFQRDMQMWDMQNQYNSPAAQRERIEAAGGNAMLAFGNGVNVTSGNASNAPSLKPASSITPQLTPYTGWNLGSSTLGDFLMKSLSFDKDMEIKDATARNINAEALAKIFSNNLNEETRDALVSQILDDTRKKSAEANQAELDENFKRSTFEVRKNLENLKYQYKEKELDKIELEVNKLQREATVDEALKTLQYLCGTNEYSDFLIAILSPIWAYINKENKLKIINHIQQNNVPLSEQMFNH